MSNSEQTTKAKQTAEKPKLTPEQREAQRKQALDDAAKKAVSSVTNLRAYLAVQSRFERYSTNNNLLIFAQRPDATRLKSLELWNKEKKWIREGAKAVAIYEPVRKQGKDGKTYLAHTLNNTCVAPPRMLIAFLENHLQADGSVTIPEVLQPYMGGLKVMVPTNKKN